MKVSDTEAVAFLYYPKVAVKVGQLRMVEAHSQELESNLQGNFFSSNIEFLDTGKPVPQCVQEGLDVIAWNA